MKKVNVDHLLSEIEFESEAHFLAFMSAVALAKDGIMAVAVPVFSEEQVDTAMYMGVKNIQSVGITPPSHVLDSASKPETESDHKKGDTKVTAKAIEINSKAQKASFDAAMLLLEKGFEFIPVPVFNQREGIEASDIARVNLENQGLDPSALPDLNAKSIH